MLAVFDENDWLNPGTGIMEHTGTIFNWTVSLFVPYFNSTIPTIPLTLRNNDVIVVKQNGRRPWKEKNDIPVS